MSSDTGAPMQLVKYNAMCRAIAEAHAVDEVKDIRDKMQALEHYHKQARNHEAEAKAAEIRIRAERKVGQLLKEMEKAKGAKGNPGGRGAPVVRSSDETAQPKTLDDLGISKNQSSRWQKLAEVPDQEFEESFSTPIKPTTSGILNKQKTEPQPKPAPVDPARNLALRVWGEARDMRDLSEAAIPAEISKAMTDLMLADIEEALPAIMAWCNQLQKAIQHERNKRERVANPA